MAEYVVCASCGARIRADRRWCLKCDEPLVGAVDWNEPIARRDRRVVAATVVSLFLLIAIALVWAGRTTPLDDTPHAVAGAVPTSPAPATAAAAVASASDTFTPVSALDYSHAGAASFGNGDFEAARTHFEQAVQKQPDDAEALNKLGQALVRLHRADEAIERFSRATQIAPEKWAYHFNLAHALADLGRWDPAIAEYRTAAGLFPEDYATQYNLALALHKKGDETAAVPEFEKAIALAPGEPSFHLSLAMSLEKLGRVADARQEYARYLEMSPDSPETPRLKAHLEALAHATASPGGL